MHISEGVFRSQWHKGKTNRYYNLIVRPGAARHIVLAESKSRVKAFSDDYMACRDFIGYQPISSCVNVYTFCIADAKDTR